MAERNKLESIPLSSTGSAPVSSRQSGRYRVPAGVGASMAFVHPHPGGTRHVGQVIELGRGGLSFSVAKPVALAVGATLVGVVLRIDHREVRGEFTVVHLATEPGGEAVYGGRFRPADGMQHLKLQYLLDRFEANS